VNDRYGHDAGDRVLEATAARIGQTIRTFDDAYRLGGEEFLICLKRTSITDALSVLTRLREGLQAGHIALPGGGEIAVTASFGVVEAIAGAEIDDLLVAADKALYRAKNAGRNRIEIAG
jgi:diguanylate cyclase